MPLRQQRNDGPRLIDDDIKQSSDVTSEHADIERFQFCDGSELATEDDLPSVFRVS